MRVKELTFAVDEHIESALIDKTIALGDDVPDPSQLSKEELVAKMSELLDVKGELDTEAEKTVENLRVLETTYIKKVRELESIEEKFNQCVAIIPETDEATVKLSREIQKLKEKLDGSNKDFSEAKESLNTVG